MGLWDTVEFAHMALRLVPEILDPVDMVLLVGEQLRVVDPEVMEVRHIKHVGSPANRPCRRCCQARSCPQ
jgi:hypothetical protein